MKRSDSLYKEVKERYEAEMHRKTELNNMVSIPIGLIPVLIGALAFFFNNLPENSNTILFVLFWVFLSLSFFLVVLCLCGFYRHQIGYTYAYIPDPDILQQYEEDFINSIKDDSDEHIIYKAVDTEMKSVLHELRVKATKINIECNESKISRYRMLIIFIVLTFLFIAITFVFRMCLENKPSEVVRIKSDSPIMVDLKDSAIFRFSDPIQCNFENFIKINNSGK